MDLTLTTKPTLTLMHLDPQIGSFTKLNLNHSSIDWLFLFAHYILLDDLMYIATISLDLYSNWTNKKGNKAMIETKNDNMI